MPVGYLPPTAFPITPRDIWVAARARPDALATVRREFTALLDVAAVYPVASGRTALALLLRTLQSQAAYMRQEVALPAYTCPSLIKVIVDCGLTPRLVDLDTETLEFAPGAPARVLGPNTLAFIFVHPFGLALDARPVIEAAHKVEAVVIEDAAQAMGAKRRGRYAGTLADYGIFSTGPGKPLALGGGGLLTANRTLANAAQKIAALEQAWRALPSGGMVQATVSVMKLAAVGLLFHPWGWRLAASVGIDRAGDSEAGQTYAMRQMSAAAAAAAVRLVPAWAASNRQRRATAQLLMEALAEVPGLFFPVAPEPAAQAQDGDAVESMYLRLPVLAPDAAVRDRWVQLLQRHGIGAGKMYRRTLAERYPALGFSPPAYPGATALARRLFTLPTHHHMTPRQIARVVALFRHAR